jgi:hypothetical protein
MTEDPTDSFDINEPDDVIEPAPPVLPVEPALDIAGLTPDEKRVFLRDLLEGYYSGASRIRFRERDVTFRSLQEMKKIIDELKAELNPAPRPRPAVFTTFGRGY